jgi:hypothetical protein
LSLGLLSKHFWIDEETVACGQSEKRAYHRFRFLASLEDSNSAIPTLEASVHWDKNFASKKWLWYLLFLLLLFNLLHHLP